MNEGRKEPLVEIKESGWFAAGREVKKALFLLSDGGFRLYLYFCLNANRSTARVFIHYGEVATKLNRSRRSIATHFDELRASSVCHVVSAAVNQHSRTEVEICDEFWPYTKERSADKPSEWSGYRAAIKSMLSKRACINCEFTATDEQFAAELFRCGVSLEQIEQAIALACCRKYVGLINGTDNEMIRRFSYFRDTIEEVRDPDANPKQPGLLKQRIMSAEYYEEKWLERGGTAGAHFASAARIKSKKTR
jgi:hypothetical protein